MDLIFRSGDESGSRDQREGGGRMLQYMMNVIYVLGPVIQNSAMANITVVDTRQTERNS